MSEVTQEPHHSIYPRTIWKMHLLLGAFGLVIVLLCLLLIEGDMSITGEGQVEHAAGATVFAPSSGLVAKVLLREGDRVEQGTAVLEFYDPEWEKLELERARRLLALRKEMEQASFRLQELDIKGGGPELSASEARAELMRKIVESQREIVRQFRALESQALRALDLHREEIQQLQVEVQALEANTFLQWEQQGLTEVYRMQVKAFLKATEQQATLLEEEATWLRERREAMTVRAPTAGTLAALAVRYPNQRVEAGAYLFRVIDLESPYQVEVLVDERNLDLLRVGTPARMKSRVNTAVLAEEIMGVIAEIAVLPEHSEDSGAPPQFEIEVAIEDDSFNLVPGSTMDVEFVVGERTLLQVMLDSLSGNSLRARLSRQEEEVTP